MAYPAVAAGNPAASELFIVSASGNGARFGICKGFNWAVEVEVTLIPDEGQVGDSSVNITRMHGTGTIRYLNKGAIPPGTKGSTVLTTRSGQSNMVVDTLSNTKYLGFRKSMTADQNAPAMYEQDFRIEDDFALGVPPVA